MLTNKSNIQELEIETPAYVFDLSVLSSHAYDIRRNIPFGTTLCYAMKANPFIIDALVGVVDYFEVCSFGEFKICERSTVTMNSVIVSGVYKNPNELEYIIANYGDSPIYTIESRSQWDLLLALARQYQLRLTVLLRLSSGNQFGIDEKELLELVDLWQGEIPFDLRGIHYFAGTQKRSSGKYMKELNHLATLIRKIEDTTNLRNLRLEYGPGLPIDYFKEYEEDNMLENLSDVIYQLGIQAVTTLEIGRYMAASCGTYYTRVVDTKMVNNENYCIVDGGIHHVNYFGQNMAMKTPVVSRVIDKKGVNANWTVFGSLCTTSDILVRNKPFEQLELGDILKFSNTGAYAVTEGIALFLSHDLPVIYFRNDVNHLIKVRDSISTHPLNYIGKKEHYE